MAGPLVPQNASPAFSQQGSVDWVELSSRSVGFSVAVLARLSKAGVDPFTLQVAKAICFNLSLEPKAQEMISDAILKLKKYSSYGDLIWFGFGVKHIVTDLAETEEGLTFVALCAALTSTYDSLYAARVLRELCILCKAPQSFTPALRQWKALIELCAGILAASHFELVLGGFRRLISPSYITTLNTEPSALAKAILIVGEVSKKKVSNATFRGDLNCAWLAAFAECIISMNVAIWTTSGATIYRSQSDKYQLPQISIIVSQQPLAQTENLRLHSKTSLVPSWDHLLYQDDQSPAIGNMRWRCDWTNILHQTFGGAVEILLSGETGREFKSYLYHVSLMENENPGYLRNLVDPLIWAQDNSKGNQFLEFASRRLPELRECLQGNSEAIHQEYIARTGRLWSMDPDPYLAIQRVCTCSRCHHSSGNDSQLCLATLAEVIIIFLWITITIMIDDEIRPSITGLSDLYKWHYESRGNMFDRLAPKFYPLRNIDLIFHVLSGISPASSYATPLQENYNRGGSYATPQKNYNQGASLALAGAGMCVYYYALETPNLSAGLISKLRCVQGYIAHSGARFKDIVGLTGPVSGPQPLGVGERFNNLSFEIVVQENENESQLEMAYQIRYTDLNDMHNCRWLNLVVLFRELRALTRFIRCSGHCSGVDSFRSIYNRNMMREAQEAINEEDFNSNTWVVTSILGGNWHNHVISMENYFVLYLSLAIGLPDKTAQCIYPAIKCLPCIIDASMGTCEDSRAQLRIITKNKSFQVLKHSAIYD